jgi:hypothetical protein
MRQSQTYTQPTNYARTYTHTRTHRYKSETDAESESETTAESESGLGPYPAISNHMHTPTRRAHNRVDKYELVQRAGQDSEYEPTMNFACVVNVGQPPRVM